MHSGQLAWRTLSTWEGTQQPVMDGEPWGQRPADRKGRREAGRGEAGVAPRPGRRKEKAFIFGKRTCAPGSDEDKQVTGEAERQGAIIIRRGTCRGHHPGRRREDKTGEEGCIWGRGCRERRREELPSIGGLERLPLMDRGVSPRQDAVVEWEAESGSCGGTSVLV